LAIWGLAGMNEKVMRQVGLGKSAFIDQNWFFAIVAISMTPLVQGLLTTTLDGYVSYGQSVTRILSIITILMNFYVLNLAIKNRVGCCCSSSFSKIPIYLLIIVFAIALFPIFLHSKSVFFSLFITIRYAFQIATIYAIIYIISRSSSFDPSCYVSIMGFCAFLYVGYIAMIALIVPHPSTFPWDSGLPSATNIRHIGNYVAIFLVAAIALFLFARDRYQGPYLSLIFVLVAFLGWTGSRAAFVGIGAALFGSVLILRGHIPMARVGILGATFAAALIATIPLPAPTPAFGVMRMFNASDVNQDKDISSGRTEVWQNTINEISDEPFIGHGAGSFIGNMSEKYGYDLDNPHNFILQFAYDWGLIGLGLCLVLLAMAGVTTFKMPVISPIASFCAISGFILMITIGMLEGMFYHPLKMLLVSALVAPAFGLAKRQHRTQ
jgi:O-antigen ligase